MSLLNTVTRIARGAATARAGRPAARGAGRPTAGPAAGRPAAGRPGAGGAGLESTVRRFLRRAR